MNYRVLQTTENTVTFKAWRTDKRSRARGRVWVLSPVTGNKMRFHLLVLPLSKSPSGSVTQSTCGPSNKDTVTPSRVTDLCGKNKARASNQCTSNMTYINTGLFRKWRAFCPVRFNVVPLITAGYSSEPHPNSNYVRIRPDSLMFSHTRPTI